MARYYSFLLSGIQSQDFVKPEAPVWVFVLVILITTGFNYLLLSFSRRFFSSEPTHPLS